MILCGLSANQNVILRSCRGTSWTVWVISGTLSVILVVHIPYLLMKATNSRSQNQLGETTCSMTLLLCNVEAKVLWVSFQYGCGVKAFSIELWILTPHFKLPTATKINSCPVTTYHFCISFCPLSNLPLTMIHLFCTFFCLTPWVEFYLQNFEQHFSHDLVCWSIASGSSLFKAISFSHAHKHTLHSPPDACDLQHMPEQPSHSHHW